MNSLFLRLPKILITLLPLFFPGCKEGTKQSEYAQDRLSKPITQHHKSHKSKEQYNIPSNKFHAKSTQDTRSRPENQVQSASQQRIPKRALDVLVYVRQYERAPSGYVGGRRFGNFENHLPRMGTDGQRIEYKEWDVNPKLKGRNRGAERLVTGSDGRAWYTGDHYNTFVEIK